MKAYMVEKFVGSGPPYTRIDMFHYIMFHGAPDESAGRRVAPCLGDPDPGPLRVRRSGRWAPDISSPVPTLVVSERVRAALADLPNLDFRPVEFTKLVDVPYYPPLDDSYQQVPALQKALKAAKSDINRVFDRLPHDDRLRAEFPTFFELVVARLDDVKPGYADLRTVTSRLYKASMFGVIEHELSPRLFADYPAVVNYHNVFGEAAFARIDPYLDRDFFEVVEFDV